MADKKGSTKCFKFLICDITNKFHPIKGYNTTKTLKINSNKKKKTGRMNFFFYLGRYKVKCIPFVSSSF